MFAVYLELKNTSDILHDIYFEPSRTVRCQLLDANDKPVSTTGLPSSILVPPSFWLTLPPDSSLRFKLSIGGYMIPQNDGAVIPMLCGDWLIKSNDLNDYKLKVTLVVNPPKVDGPHWPWKGTLNLPSVKVPPRRSGIQSAGEGKILGTLRDGWCKTGIAQAVVTVTGVKIKRKLKSDSNGTFEILLPVGTYQLTVKKYGFKSYVVNEVKVSEDSDSLVSLDMEYGWVSDDPNAGKPEPCRPTN
jgi:hypothetical protein